MPRPSELLQQMVRELAAGGRQDALRELGRWLDQLNAQADPTTLRIGGGGGGETVDAPANAPYLTVGAASGLSAYRQIAHDATLSHSDGGALGSYTLGVVANGHRHIEENIDETNYLVVDAGGRGDFTTLTDALNSVTANGSNGERWTIVVRSDLSEVISWNPGAGKSQISVHVWSPGFNTLAGRVDGDAYGQLYLHNLNIVYTAAAGDNNAALSAANGNAIYAYGCTITRSQTLSPAENVVIKPAGGSVYLYDCTVSQLLSSPYSVFYGAGDVYAYNCIITAMGGRGIAEANFGASYYFYFCVLLNQDTADLFNTAGSGGVYVARCRFNTAAGGSYTVLDGDVPASALAGYVPTSRTIGTTAPLSGGGDLSANRTLAISQAGSASDGYLSSADWTTFNNKQPAGNYLTALTGDVTATGPGSVAATLATVNANVGTFGSATQVAQVTANAKGLITAIANVTITGASPVGAALTRGSIWRGSAANLAEAYALGAANKVLQSDGTDAIWSANTLAISGNSTINGSLVGNITGGGTLATGGFTLTVPATGTAALGTGTTSTVARWTGTNTLGNSIIQDNGTNLGIGTAPISASLVDARPSTTITSGTYNGFNVVYSANPSGASTGVYQGLAFTAGTQSGNAQNITGSVRGVVGQAQHNGTGTLTTLTAMDIQHQLSSSGNVTTARGIRLSGVVSSTGRANTNLGIDIDTNYAVTSVNTAINIAASSAACNLKYGISVGAISGGTGANVAIETMGGQLQFTHNANSTLATFTGHSTFTASTPLMLLKRNDGNTNAVATMLGLNVNTTGTAAAGFGGSIALNLESSTTADQAAAALKWLWTDATHATRTSRADIETTGPGKCAAWGYNGIDGTARTMIANGTGDVTEGVTVQYVASEVTGADSYGGVVYLEPSDSFVINTDGTNALTLACAADGSLTVQRTAGTDTYKFQCWMVWV